MVFNERAIKKLREKTIFEHQTIKTSATGASICENSLNYFRMEFSTEKWDFGILVQGCPHELIKKITRCLKAMNFVITSLPNYLRNGDMIHLNIKYELRR